MNWELGIPAAAFIRAPALPSVRFTPVSEIARMPSRTTDEERGGEERAMFTEQRRKFINRWLGVRGSRVV